MDPNIWSKSFLLVTTVVLMIMQPLFLLFYQNKRNKEELSQ